MLDKDVVVEEDVWVGCNVTLLAGVTIGRGSTVAAGAVVSKSMPPYCICGGIPAKFIKFYWTIDQILEHEAKLYSEEERYFCQVAEEVKGNTAETHYDILHGRRVRWSDLRRYVSDGRSRSLGLRHDNDNVSHRWITRSTLLSE